VTGRSAIGCNLVVIWNDKIVWDPSPDAVGIVGPAFGNPAVGFIVEFLGVRGGAVARIS
jgi:hypothetical protein